MSYNGSGVYTLPGAALANGEIVSATENNQFRNDVAAALNVAWTRDGQAPATANIPMGSHKLTGLAAGTGVGDSVRFEQLPSATNKLDLTTSVTGTLPVANGGSGAATLTGVLKGNGTSAFTAAVAGTDYLAPAAIGTTVQGYAAELQGATQGGINGMKNRIINGAMMIDQRNAGVSVTPTSTGLTLDRWQASLSVASKYSVQRSTTAPVGFSNSLLVTSASAYTVGSGEIFDVRQKIEGFNVADLAWGTANAQSVTLSFQVRSSLTGTFGGALMNADGSRCYPFSYTISSAGTFETKSVTITGCTDGTWNTDNSAGIQVCFGLGVGSTYSGTAGAWATSLKVSSTGATSVVGTNGATFYITGVQLEKGSTATSFDYRPYGTELALCQRYYYKITATDSGSPFGSGYCYTTTVADIFIPLPVQMRTNPTSLEQNGTANNYGLQYNGTSNACSSVPVFTGSSASTAWVRFTMASGLTVGQGVLARSYTASNSQYLAFPAEL